MNPDDSRSEAIQVVVKVVFRLYGEAALRFLSGKKLPEFQFDPIALDLPIPKKAILRTLLLERLELSYPRVLPRDLDKPGHQQDHLGVEDVDVEAHS
jgi:hypothetical protein